MVAIIAYLLDVRAFRRCSNNGVSMILPSISHRSAHPKIVSALWEELHRHEESLVGTAPRYVPYDWFLRAWLFCTPFGTNELDRGLVARRSS